MSSGPSSDHRNKSTAGRVARRKPKTKTQRTQNGRRSRTIGTLALNVDRLAAALRKAAHFKNSGEISLGKNNGISGNRMHAASTTIMGTSMISVSLSANLSGTLATAHEIIRHNP